MDATLQSLTEWMPAQRWYAAKGRTPALRLVASWEHPAEDPSVTAQTLLVSDDAGAIPVLYQVPVVTRPSTTVTDEGAVIAAASDGVALVDGPRDPAYTTALLALAARGGSVGDGTAGAAGHPAVAATQAPLGIPGAVLRGEQSNTSIIFRGEEGTPVICKVFRQVHPGLNPDIELQTALADAGSPFVPRAVGSIEGRFAGSDGSLAFAQEFLPGVEDAWRVALRAAAGDLAFADEAAALGEATAHVHLSLSELFDTERADDRSAIAAAWRRRLDEAAAEVPEIAAARPAIETLYDAALRVSWPALQRIHGDYHLGQVILVPGRGWVLLDFEGEPLRPMDERRRPDLALRDVAGMLRSFDYVAGSIRADGPASAAESVGAWADAARAAFLAGYENVSALSMSALAPLVKALEADKAVYEAIYEARNRPTWLPIPLAAIQRLLD